MLYAEGDSIDNILSHPGNRNGKISLPIPQLCGLLLVNVDRLCVVLFFYVYLLWFIVSVYCECVCTFLWFLVNIIEVIKGKKNKIHYPYPYPSVL